MGRYGNTGINWSNAEINTVKQAILDGKSYREISAIINDKFGTIRTRNSISAMNFRYLKIEVKKKPSALPEFDEKKKEEVFKFRKYKDIPLKNRRSYAVPVSLLDVKNNQCHWPLDGHMCCGAKTWAGKSYCYRHAREAFTNDSIEAIKKAMR